MCNILLAIKNDNINKEIKIKLKDINYPTTFYDITELKSIKQFLNNINIDIVIINANEYSLLDIEESINTIKQHENSNSMNPSLGLMVDDNTIFIDQYNNADVLLNMMHESAFTVNQINNLIKLRKAEWTIRKENKDLDYNLSFSEKKYKDLFNTMKNAFCFCDVIYDNFGNPIDYILIEINPAFESIFSKPIKDIIGKSITNVINSIDENWIVSFNNVIVNNKFEQFVGYNSSIDKWLDIIAYKTKNKYLAIIFNDVTKEILIDKKANRIRKDLHQILNVTSPLCVINNKQEIILVNDSFCKLFKVERVDAIKQPCYTIFGQKRCDTLCPLSKIKNNNDNSTFEITAKIKGGNYIKCLVTARPFENDNNEVIGIVETFTDITKLKKIENKLIRAKRKAEESDKLKSAFLANMSHEIRTPMNSIIGFSDLLSDDNIDIKTKNSYLSIIQTAGNDLLKLIDDIIDIAKIEAGQISIKMETVRIDALLNEVYLSLNQHPRLKANKVKLIYNKQRSNFKDSVITDGLRLKQVITNILNNAIKFTHQGSIEFGYDKKGDVLEFYIKDTGIGLTKEQVNIIWDRFRQADDSTTKKYGGAGLGLSISKGLVKLLGGDIWLDSEWKRGTTFYFSIPYVESMFATNQSVKKYKGKYDWRGHTIIIAEDVDINYKLLNDILKHTGVDIIRAKDGKECIDLYKVNKKNTSLILMDVQMPVLNGYETIKRIKKMSGYVPIIVQTAYAMNENIKKCYDVGCDDFISKPIVKEKLLNKINDLINKK